MKRSPRRAGRAAPSASRAARLAAPAAVLLAALLPYAPLLDAEYVQDDHLAIEENPIVARGDPVEIFSTSYWEGAKGNDRSLYRPLPILSFALEGKLAGGPSPRLSHAVNLLLHAVVSLSLLALARRLGASAAGGLAAALLFAVHPVHTEAVGNVVGRSELLAALFVLLSLLAMSRAGRWSGGAGSPDEEPSAGRVRIASWTAGGLVFLALCSKESAIALLPLLVLQELLLRPAASAPPRAFPLDRLAAFAPVILAIEAFAVLRILALEAVFLLQRVPLADNPLVGLDAPGRILTALAIAARYARRLVLGFPLSADYSGTAIRPESSLLSPLPAAGLLFLAALAVTALLPLRSPGAPSRGAPEGVLSVRRASLAAWLFLLPYLVVGNLLFPVGAGLAERLVYLPSAGLYLLFGLLLDRALGARGLAARLSPALSRGLAAAALAVLAVLTWQRSEEWRSDRTIFEAAVRETPESPRAHYILATLDDREGRPAPALTRVERVVALWPTHLGAWVEKAVLLGKAGDFAGAEASAREATRIDPTYALAHFNLGVALHRLGRLPEAERALRKAVLLDSDKDVAWAELGHVRFDAGKFAAAAEAYERAVALGRSYLTPRLREARARALPSGIR